MRQQEENVNRILDSLTGKRGKIEPEGIYGSVFQKKTESIRIQNELTDEKVLEAAMDLNDRMLPVIIFFVVFSLALSLFCASVPNNSIGPEVQALVCAAVSAVVSFLLYRYNEKLCRPYILSKQQVFHLQKGEFLKIRKDFQKAKTNADNYSYTVSARLSNGRKVKTTVYGAEARSYKIQKPEYVYVLTVPRHPWGVYYRIYHSAGFQNHCRNIRL